MTPATEREPDLAIEQACARTVLQLFAGMDDLRYDDVTAAFTPDGVWHRAGKALAGRAMIRAAMDERSPDRLRPSRDHKPARDRGRRDACRRPLLRDRVCRAARRAPTINAPWLVLTMTQRFERRDGAWKIAEVAHRARLRLQRTSRMTAVLPKTMQAVEITQPGGPEVLVTREHPLPVVGGG